jgi:hypothetical protein
MVGKRAYPQINPRNVQPLPGTELAANNNTATHLTTRDPFNLQLNQTVVEEHLAPGPSHLGQPAETDTGTFGCAQGFIRRQREPLAGFQFHNLVLESPHPDFRAGQVRHYRNPAARPPLGLSQGGYPARVSGKITVRKVQSRNVHAGLNESLDDFRRFGCRSDCCDYLGLVPSYLHFERRP